MRLKRLAAFPLIALLTGCPGLPGINGNAELSPKILAVTQSNGAGTTANAFLEWQGVTNASSYQVLRTIGETTERAVTTERTAFTEPVQPDFTVTYKIVAKDSSGQDKSTSANLSVKVLAASVTKPTSIVVDDLPAASDLFRTSKPRPKISWAKVDAATHYYVKVEKDGKTLYASLTDQTQVIVGSLTHESIKIPNYPQVKDQSLPEDLVDLTVTAIRANDADLAKATAIDVTPSASYLILYK